MLGPYDAGLLGDIARLLDAALANMTCDEADMPGRGRLDRKT